MRLKYEPASEPLHISVNIRNAFVNVLASFDIHLQALRGSLLLYHYAQA